tara:strand:+ start:1598 stop:1765 length:168 start_codon:yes stop_codon:yes gene_type:complete
MKKKCCNAKGDKCDITVETKLECKATAALNAQVDEELKEEDKPIQEILNNAQDPE